MVEAAEGHTEGTTPGEREWRLAPGVALQEGTVVMGEGAPAACAYTLIHPSGRRYRMAEPLYRLAELLVGDLPLAEVAQQLSARLNRPLGVADVAGLIESKLAAQGLVVPRTTPGS